jgi:hypothetical protein
MEKGGFLASCHFLIDLLINDQHNSTKIRNSRIDSLPIEKFDI